MNSTRLKKIIDEIDALKQLEWSNPKIPLWINKVLRFLKNEFGEESDYYTQFYSETKYYPIDIGASEDQLQESLQNALKRFEQILQVYLEESEEESTYNSNLPDGLKLHPKIKQVCEQLFDNKHYSQAIFEAVKILEKEIKVKSGVRDKSGVSLVNHVFNKESPIIKIVEGDESWQIDEREGFRFLFMGAFLGIKNPKSHDNPKLDDSFKAIEYLSFLSLLMKRLDESTI
ncbi:MAG: TIGR02391 family protein [Candidatus Nitrosopumilus sp. bin_68KS]